MACTWAWVTACASPANEGAAPTGILVVVRSDLSSNMLQQVRVETERADGAINAVVLQVVEPEGGMQQADLAPGSAVLPASLAIYADEQDVEHGLTLRVSGHQRDGPDPQVRRTVKLRFIRGQLRRLVIHLAQACVDRFAQCEAEGRTCGGDGACIALEVDPQTLPKVAAGSELDSLAAFPDALSGLSKPPNPAPVTPSTDPPAEPPSLPPKPARPVMPGTPPAITDEGGMPTPSPMDGGMDGSVAGPSMDAGPDGGPVEPDGGATDMDANVDIGDIDAATPPDWDAGGGDGGPTAPTPTVPDVDAGPPACHSGEVRCRAGALHHCEGGDFAAFYGCPRGCYEGADRCNQCDPGEERCRGDRYEVCQSGFFAVVQACPLGCSSLWAACLECAGPAASCEPDGTLRLCGVDGMWTSARCYGSCQRFAFVADAGVSPSDMDAGVASPTFDARAPAPGVPSMDAGAPSMDAGAVPMDAGAPPGASWATCGACVLGERTCTGRDILTCEVDGHAGSLGCHFGCGSPAACREDTPAGQALMMTVL